MRFLRSCPCRSWRCGAKATAILRGAAGRQLFRGGRFFYTCQGVNLLGLDTVWQDEPHGPGFVLGEPQQRWLAEMLPRLDPAAPLIVLSHAPLAPIYRPWGQWTRDSGPWLDRLADFHNVTYVHGHVHHADIELRQIRSLISRRPMTRLSEN